MAKQQRVSVEQYVTLTDWCRTNKRSLEANENTQAEAAALAEGDLGFAVPITSMQRCAKIAEIRWAKSPPPPPAPPIEREAIIILIGALEGLYIETGRTVPALLANLKSTYVRAEDTTGRTTSVAAKQIKNKDIQIDSAVYDPYNKGERTNVS
jgi:hypothetical protein